MSKEIKLNDFINHIETDMGQMLKVMERPLVFEVMLNAYETQDGFYEGHIWYEEAGKGMQRLTTQTILPLPNYPKPNNGDLIVIKKSNNQILSWHVLPNELPEHSTNHINNDPSSEQSKLTTIISTVIRSNIIELQDKSYQLEQEEHYKLNELAQNIRYNRYHPKEAIPIEDFLDVKLMLTKINALITELRLCYHLEVIEYNETTLTLDHPTSRLTLQYEKMTASKAQQIIGILAAATYQHCHEKQPVLECAMPYFHHRFTGTLPPVTPFPTMCIRKHSSKLVTLDEYVDSGVMSKECRDTIKHWVKSHFNILIAGGTGSGKTTMANAILDEIAVETPQDRVGIIEDTPELQCSVENHYKMCKTNEVDMQGLLRTNLRYRPDRIVVGEVRGKEAYVLLKAWMSGHPGGLATIHANGAKEATHRFEQCILENPEAGKYPRDDIGMALNGIISIQKVTVRQEKNGKIEYAVKRKVTALRQIMGYDKKHNIYEDIYVYRDDSSFEREDDENTASKDNYLD